MLFIGLTGTEVTATERHWLAAPAVVGVILFARNFINPVQLLAFTRSIRALGGENMLVAVDQEGGVVQRFRTGFTMLPALSKIGEAYDNEPENALALAEEHAWVMATQLLACEVDVSFAPVVDLARGNTAIGSRAFHSDPQVTAELAEAYVRGMHLAGMAAVLKHFPGHGSVIADTHKVQVMDPRPLDVISATDLRSFAAVLEGQIEAVMVNHVIYSAVDTSPAGYSRVWIQDILRGHMGFNGLVISDDIGMTAAKVMGSVSQRVRSHLTAGCDLLLACSPGVVPEAIRAVPSHACVNMKRLAALRGHMGIRWDDLRDNPQCTLFIERLKALNT